MTLREWCDRHRAERGITREEAWRDLAGRTGLRPLALRRYSVGFRHPRPSAIRAIARATGGAVMPEDWFPDLYPGRAQAAVAPVEAAA